MGSSAEKANGFSKEQLMDLMKSFEIPELKGDTFARTSELNFINKHSRTLQSLRTKVIKLTREACNCNHILRRTFNDFPTTARERCNLFKSLSNIEYIEKQSYVGFSNALYYRVVVFLIPILFVSVYR